MARPLSRAQQLENAAFLRLLRLTGNVRATCERLGAHRARFTRRRAKHPAFAAAWDAALAVAHAALREGDRPQDGQGGAPHAKHPASRTGEPEPHLHRTPGGRVQLRRSGARRRLTRAAEQAFLAALGATANVRLSAAAAGFSHGAFYARARADAGFAREMRLALQMGYDRLEMALLEAMQPGSHRDDAWRHNDPPPIPPMTAAQALQLLYLHQKEARLLAEPAHLRRRRGESADVHSFRLAAMYESNEARQREAFEIAEAARRARGEPWLFGPEHLPERPALPDLAQVTGWSKAKARPHPASPAGREPARARPAGGTADSSDDAGFGPASGADHPHVALFGGWRLKDLER
ncbi:MAG: hypothetical protein B7Y45_14345 [Sphingomonas sp. 28-66-16]|nr:MAG: hypothetical protein B7Y45_14345 [Sphingomonas sp. 28-66-16]